MKAIKIFLFAALCTMLCHTEDINAQGMEFGVKAGFNLGTPYGIAEKGATGSPGLGPAVGVWFRARLNLKWRVQAEFAYSKKGSTFKNPYKGDTVYRVEDHDPPYIVHTYFDGWVEGEFDNAYLDIPVIFMYLLNERWSLLIGPQFSYLLKGKNTGKADFEIGDPENPFDIVEDYPFDESSALRKWDYGVLIGSSYNVSKKFFVGLTLTAGLNSIYQKDYSYIERTYRNVYLQACLGFKISS